MIIYIKFDQLFIVYFQNNAHNLDYFYYTVVIILNICTKKSSS